MNASEKSDILIVDDRPENLLVLENLLERPDFNIVRATSGNQALGLMLEHDFALVLLDTDLSDDQRRYAETVRASGESLLMIISDILDFSKIEAGKLEMETLDFDLRALLDDFAEVMALKVYEKGLEFICAAAPETPALLRGDPGRLHQVLINLTGNAVKFTHEGEIAVFANLESKTDKEVMVRFSVRDTGTGIPPDNQDRLFRQFTQVDASTTRKYGGTGLGLAISKQLAEAMGGEIGVESEEGRGFERR